MPTFPPSMSLVTATCHFQDFPGATTKGQVVFHCPVTLQGPSDNVIVKPFDYTVIFDETGSVSVQLPACDDPDWSPNDWLYKVQITSNGHLERGTLFLSHTDTVVSLAERLNIPAPVPASNYILSSARGAAGGVAGLGSDGFVPDSQLRYPILVLDAGEDLPPGMGDNTLVFRKS